MQVSKLKAGTEYLVSTSPKWREDVHYGQFRGRLVDTTTRYARKNNWSSNFVENAYGEYLKLIEVDGDGADGTVRYALPRDIRGEWESAKAEQDANIAERREAAAAAAKRRADAADFADTLEREANALGLPVAARQTYDGWKKSGRYEFVISLDDLRKWINDQT
jgi:hypothetical protein